MNVPTRRTPRFLLLAASAALVAVGACDYDDDPFGLDSDLGPRALEGRYEWLLEGWGTGTLEPVGRPAVHLSWELPPRWDGEPFRVYGRRSGSDYLLIATVTSCARELCLYTDVNVQPDERYDYYVATVDQRSGDEVQSDDAVQVRVPATPALATPGAPAVTALDGALYLRWTSTGVERYQVFLERIGDRTDFILLGETDGTGFLDERAENGTTYAYRVAAVDSLGHVSDRSELGSGTPRPDYRGEVAYAHADSVAASGFRFVLSDRDDPLLSGDSPSAQWRWERAGNAFRIVPRGSTRVSGGTFTTSLNCGPGEESDGESCLAVTTAPPDAELGTAPVTVEAGDTYVLRVAGDDGRVHFGKVRVVGSATDSRGVPVVIFDWAYQLRPDTRSLSVQPAN